MEVRVVASLVAKPEYLEEVTATLHEIIEPSRLEVGCIQYELHQDNENPAGFVFFERWRSQEALDKHSNSEHFGRFASQLEGKLASLDIKTLKQIA
ncbi:antibiotic biosynthesis monooxygenase [Chimaeribacter californicus]|jgi:quinol monooxygenase YgiN|uniref:Antibiotic biosynthesis monooxygenase n=1 Tax=Chimaeribacter californicus TaxID=2060067 RepID=A0A2N5EFX8_9GAMM|nr:putative quinol monooxygenase [Chimaeribacter californicus]PLR41431.1 antibiotic biosynthesis monooxygenase [Chimaeribacter californicus]